MHKYGASTDFFVQQLINEAAVESNDNNAEPDQRVTEHTVGELLQKLRESRHQPSQNTHQDNLRKTGEKLSQKKSALTVYYPYCGADVTHAFLLFPHCTTMVGFGRDDFGSIEDLNYYNENNDFVQVPISYAMGFDSHKYHNTQAHKYPDNKYKVCPDVLLRITQVLGGEILSVDKNQLGEGKNDCVYQIHFMLDGIERTFIYAKYEIQTENSLTTINSPVRDYLVSQTPDALLLKAIPDYLLECKDGLALACASVTQSEQIVVSDARTYSWNKRFSQADEPQPVFLKNASLDSIKFQGSIGYGSTLFIGHGAQLRRELLLEQEVQESDEDINDSSSEIETASVHNEPVVIGVPKQEQQSDGAKKKSGTGLCGFKFFAPIKALGNALNKVKNCSISCGSSR